MKFRFVLFLVAISIVTACSGGDSTTGTNDALHRDAPTSSIVYAFGGAAATYSAPQLDGYRATFAFPQSHVPNGTTLTLISLSRAPAGNSVFDGTTRRRSDATATQTTGALDAYYYAEMSFSYTVTFATVPVLSVVLPSTVHPVGQFYYAISDLTAMDGAKRSFRTQGPATIAGQTLSVFRFIDAADARSWEAISRRGICDERPRVVISAGDAVPDTESDRDADALSDSDTVAEATTPDAAADTVPDSDANADSGSDANADVAAANAPADGATDVRSDAIADAAAAAIERHNVRPAVASSVLRQRVCRIRRTNRT